jgi:hypothetical protein
MFISFYISRRFAELRSSLLLNIGIIRITLVELPVIRGSMRRSKKLVSFVLNDVISKVFYPNGGGEREFPS